MDKYTDIVVPCLEPIQLDDSLLPMRSNTSSNIPLLNEDKEKLCSIIDNRVDINKNSEADASAVESDHEEKC